MPEAEAVKSDATDLKTLREMCKMRGIVYHHKHKAESLRKLLDNHEVLNAPPDDLKDQVEVANPGFSDDAKPQEPKWAAPSVLDIDKMREIMDDAPVSTKGAMLAETAPAKPPAAETFTPAKREIPNNVTDALEWFSHSSIGRVKLITKYIESLL